MFGGDDKGADKGTGGYVCSEVEVRPGVVSGTGVFRQQSHNPEHLRLLWIVSATASLLLQSSTEAPLE